MPQPVLVDETARSSKLEPLSDRKIMSSVKDMERRMSQMRHPDLPFDITRHSMENRSQKSSKSWRPSWISSRSASTRSCGSSRHTLSSIDSHSTGVSASSARRQEHQNTYQLPINSPDASRNIREEEVQLPMRISLESCVFEFPIPATLASSVKKEPEPFPVNQPNSSSYPPRLSSRHARGPPRAGSTTAMSTSGRTDSSRSTGNSSRKDRNLFAEIEMASREQYGYWRASLTARIPPAAAVCGCSILTSRLSSRQAKNIDTTSRGDVVEDAYLLCQTLDESSTPEEALQTLHAQSASIDVLVIALQASIEAAQLSTVPVKIAASMYEKTFEAKSKPKKREALFPSLIKLLRKIPQDTLVVLMFLLTIAQRLQAKGITIDDREPALFLLRSLLPTSLALSPDHFAGDSVSRLLAIHFDEIPGDMPLVLESVNHRFAAGKKVNLLSLISGQSGKAQRQSQKPGPGGVREIEGAEDKEIQW